MTDLVLLAPLAGWLLPLTDTPDPVFAEKMLGDGVAIDPTVGGYTIQLADGCTYTASGSNNS